MSTQPAVHRDRAAPVPLARNAAKRLEPIEEHSSAAHPVGVSALSPSNAKNKGNKNNG